MSKRLGQHLRNGKTYFPELVPLRHGLEAVVATTPRVHAVPNRSLDSPSLEDRLTARERKLMRRSRRAGHDIDAFLMHRNNTPND